MRKLSLPLLSFFLILFSIAPAMALTSFNPNPVMTDNALGYLIEDSYMPSAGCGLGWCLTFWNCPCTNGTMAFNDTWVSGGFQSDTDGKLVLMNITSGAGNYSLNIIPLNTLTFLHTANQTQAEAYEEAYSYLTIPKSKEVIVAIRMRVNGTSNMRIDSENAPQLIVSEIPYDVCSQRSTGVSVSPSLGSILKFETYTTCTANRTVQRRVTQLIMNVTAKNNQEYAFSAILPANIVNERYYQFAVQLNWNGLATSNVTIEMDKFNVYTMDIQDSTNRWTNDANTSRTTFCGRNSWFMFEGSATLLESNDGNWKFSNATSFLLGVNRDLFDSGRPSQSLCGAFQMNDVTIAKRFDSTLIEPGHAAINDSIRYSNMLFSSNLDLMVAHSWGSANPCVALVEGLLTTTVKLTNYICPAGATNATFNVSFPNTNYSLISLMKNNANAIRSTITTTPYQTVGLPTSTLFRIFVETGGAQTNYSSYYNLFGYAGGCTVAPYCANNYAGIQQANCSVVNNTYCGDFGCEGEGEGFGCKYGFIGSYCSDNTTYIIKTLSGATGGICTPPYKCRNTTDGFDCYDTSTGGSVSCYDSAGNVIACTGAGLDNTTSDVAFSTKEWVNYYMGNSNGASILAAVFSVGLSFVVFFKSKSKKIETFIVPMFIMLGIFAMPGIAWFPTWIFFVMVVFSAMMIFFKVKGG